ncbi:MAG: hypothetical protein WB611_30620 [Stellaceae bacterium]
MSGIRGKKHIPRLKDESRRWRFDHDSAGIKVTQNESDPIAVVNESAKEITVTVRRDPYTPVAVLKAFTKMALSLLPETEVCNFQAAMTWIRNPDHKADLVKTGTFPVLYTFVPGNVSLGNSVILLRRRANHLPLPYMTFVLTYGNEMFQTVVPSPERDAVISDQKIKFSCFPNPYELTGDIEPAAPIQRERIDLTGRCIIKGEMIETVLRYGE